MDLRQIRTFITVADRGTVSAAAEHLHTTQPALSRQIANLEEGLGVRLFDRIGRRLSLTSEGAELLDNCRGLLNAARAITEQAEGLRRGDAGVLRVAATPHLIEGLFPEFLAVYGERFPNVKVTLIDAVGRPMLEMLRAGEIHLAQTAVRALMPSEHGFGSYPLAPMQMLAACHSDLKLGRNGRVDIAELAHFPLLQATEDFVMRRNFDSACRIAGFTPHYVLECRSPHALLAMAEAGHGVAIIPSALRVHRYALRLLRVIQDGKALDEPLSILFDKRRPLPGYAKAFCEMLAKQAQRTFPVRSIRRAP